MMPGHQPTRYPPLCQRGARGDFQRNDASFPCSQIPPHPPLAKGGKRWQRGFTLLELVVVIALVGVLGAAALDRLWFYQEQAEKVVMEQTASILRSAMRLQMADLIVRQEISRIPGLANQNPMDWLAEKPGNYLGEFSNPAPGSMAPGNWYFDSKQRVLVYLVERGNHFVPDRSGIKQVRYRVTPVESLRAKENGGMADVMEIAGLKLVPVEPYRWF